MTRNKLHIMQEDFENEEENEWDDDFYSPTSWDKDPFETDEDYQDRIQDQEDLLEYFDADESIKQC